jgi:uncharacterized protein YjiS (DUF1127 family)
MEDPAMSASLSPAPLATPVTQLALRTLRRAWRRFRHDYDLALRDELSRRTLRRLDDRMLDDIGLVRAQADIEANRRPWTLV